MFVLSQFSHVHNITDGNLLQTLSVMFSHRHGGRIEGRNWCSSSIWKGLSTDVHASGITQLSDFSCNGEVNLICLHGSGLFELLDVVLIKN